MNGPEGLARRPLRRRRWWLAPVTVVAVVAFAFLQVPPLDSWRWHRVFVWQPQPVASPAGSNDEPQGLMYSDKFALPAYGVARLTWAGGRSMGWLGTFRVGSGTNDGRLLDWSNPGDRMRFWWPLAFVSQSEGSVFGSAGAGDGDLYFTSDNLLRVVPRGAADDWRIALPNREATEIRKPPLTFEVWEVYGFFFLPIEDWIVILALLGWLARRRYGRSGNIGTSTEDDAVGA
jgi:hypothetical protein